MMRDRDGSRAAAARQPSAARWPASWADDSSMPTISIRRANVAKMASGCRIDRRRSLAVAAIAIVAAMRDIVARGQAARARLLGAEGSVPRPACAAAWAQSTSAHRLSQGRHARRSSRGSLRAAGITCRRRCWTSQFAALEEPGDAIVVDIRQTVADTGRGRSPRHCASTSDPRMTSSATRAASSTGDRGRASRARSGTASGRDQHAGVSRVDDPVRLGRRLRSRRSAASHEPQLRPARPAHRAPTCRPRSPTLEGGYAALAVPSGLAATTLPLLALTQRRRSRAGHRFGLRPDAALLQQPSARDWASRSATTIR